MIKRKYAALIILTLVLILSPQVQARGGGREERDDRERVRVKVKIAQSAPVPQEKVEIRNNEFEITGLVTVISGKSITVAGHVIVIDPAEVDEFEQKGVLALGNTVKVEGVTKNNTKFAQEITVFGTKEGDFRLKVEGTKNALEQIRVLLEQILSLLRNHKT